MQLEVSFQYEILAIMATWQNLNDPLPIMLHPLSLLYSYTSYASKHNMYKHTSYCDTLA